MFLEKLVNNKAANAPLEYEPCELNYDDCDACEIKYPGNLKIEQDALRGTADPIKAQILIATGETDWKHDITDERPEWGQMCAALDSNSRKLSKLVGGSVRINGTNMEADGDEIDVIVLPHFVQFKSNAKKCVQQVSEILALEPGSKLPDFAQPVNQLGFILLCSHRKRDKRCGITAKFMKQALETELRHTDLYRGHDDDEPSGVKVLLVNHMGGHKFAANALIYKNNGMAIMLGRLQPWHAKSLVENTILGDSVVPELVRCSSKLKAYEW